MTEEERMALYGEPDPSTSGTQEAEPSSATPTSSSATSAPRPTTPPADPTDTDTENEEEVGANDGYEEVENVDSWFSDSLPVRVAMATPWKTKMEANTMIPYSPMFTSITERLADPAATGALGSMTRGPSMVDRASVLALAKYTAASTTSVLEIAAMVRLGCLTMSVSSQCYETEIINYRLIRGWKVNEYLGFEITAVNHLYPNTYITAVPLDTFVSYCFGKCQYNIVEHDEEEALPTFLPLEIDSQWVAIPVKMSHINSSYLIPMIASFMTTSLYAGKVNHVFSGSYHSSDGNQTIRSAIRLMPAANCVYLDGPKRVMLVLIEATSSSCPRNIQVGNIEIPVFTDRAEAHKSDFTEIWTHWFRNENVHQIEHDCVMANNELTTFICTENASSVGLAVTAELYSAMYLGMGVLPRQQDPQYDWAEPFLGA